MTLWVSLVLLAEAWFTFVAVHLWYHVSFCSPGLPGTYYLAQADSPCTKAFSFSLLNAELTAWTTTPGYFPFIYSCIFFFFDRVSLSSLDLPRIGYVNQTLVPLPLLLSVKISGMCHHGWLGHFSLSVKIFSWAGSQLDNTGKTGFFWFQYHVVTILL